MSYDINALSWTLHDQSGRIKYTHFRWIPNMRMSVNIVSHRERVVFTWVSTLLFFHTTM